MSYVFDMWAVGSILVELLTGFPLWLSLKSRVVTVDGRSIMGMGLFGVAGRDHSKILKKQLEVFGYGFNEFLQFCKKHYDINGQRMLSDRGFVDLLRGMLAMGPGERLDPFTVLKSPFLQSH